MHLPVNTVLKSGKYRIESVLGQGGFGITYKGIFYEKVKMSLGEQVMQAPVAIKEFFFSDYCNREDSTGMISISSVTGRDLFDKFKQKLIKEAHILSELDHPNILRVLDIFEENNTAYMIMRYIDGESLKEKFRRTGRIHPEKALDYILQVANGLEHVHDRKILHLDVKPSNIMVDQNDVCYLIDFGVSKRYDRQNHEQTSTTPIASSKGFAPIEQVLQVELNRFMPQSDIYSLGATLFFLLTESVPMDAAARNIDFENDHKFDIEKLNQVASPALIQVISKAMAFKYSERYGSVREFRQALEQAAGDQRPQAAPAPAPAKPDERTIVQPFDEPVRQKEQVSEKREEKEIQPIRQEQEKKKEKPPVKKKLIRVELIGLISIILINLIYGAVIYFGKDDYIVIDNYNEDGLRRIENDNGWWGFIDDEDNVVIPCQYLDAGEFSEGLAAVFQVNGNKYYINTLGEIAISDVPMGNLGMFKGGYASIHRYYKPSPDFDEDSYYGLIDKDGDQVIPIICEAYEYLDGVNGLYHSLTISGKKYVHLGDGELRDDFNNVYTLYNSDGNWYFNYEKPPPPAPPKQIVKINVVDNLIEVDDDIDINVEADENAEVQEYIAPVKQDDEESAEEAQIFMIVESMPEFPGGEPNLYKYLAENIKYPQMANESGIQGGVFVTFVVERDGSVTDVRVLRGIGGGCDEEAIRVVKNMPKWTPGKQLGKSVRVQYNLPLKFTLQTPN
jgi:serine/threonine-protein kinase